MFGKCSVHSMPFAWLFTESMDNFTRNLFIEREHVQTFHLSFPNVFTSSVSIQISMTKKNNKLPTDENLFHLNEGKIGTTSKLAVSNWKERVRGHLQYALGVVEMKRCRAGKMRRKKQNFNRAHWSGTDSNALPFPDERAFRTLSCHHWYFQYAPLTPM